MKCIMHRRQGVSNVQKCPLSSKNLHCTFTSPHYFFSKILCCAAKEAFESVTLRKELGVLTIELYTVHYNILYIRVHQFWFFCEFQKDEYGVCLPRVLEEEKFFFIFFAPPPIYAGSLKYADFENFHRPRKTYFLIFFFKNVFLYISRTLEKFKSLIF